MLYCTYEDYQTAGGSLDEQTYHTYALRASQLIDHNTFGRAEAHAQRCDRCKAALSAACVQIVQTLAAAQNITAVGYAPGVSGVSNDGLTISFSGGMEASFRSEAAQILHTCLGSDPHGLLYRGCF